MTERETRITGAEIIWECLIKEGVDVIFGYPGGAILPAYDALTKYDDRIHHVLVRHEQGATHMADGYARASGKVGVAMATSGPGATNMVTGLATAMMDSSPIVCITGQVPLSVIGTDAFQETDVTGITLPVTKHSFLVTEVKELAQTIHDAFRIARSGRPGPVVIDIPKCVQNETASFSYSNPPADLSAHVVNGAVTKEQIRLAADLINVAEKPVILAGHGVLLSEAMTELKQLAEEGSIPVSTTLLGIGGFPSSHPLNMGMMGMHGNAHANHAIQEADLLIACGMRFDDRVTGKLKTYSPHSKKIHIDIDRSELNKNVPADVAIHGDLKQVLQYMIPEVKLKNRKTWFKQIKTWQASIDEVEILNQASDEFMAAHAIRIIWEETGGNSIIVSDVGQHQMLEAQYYEHNEPRTLITSGGLGTMGFALPAAVGASFAVKDRDIWVIVGDGGIQMTLMELATVVQEGVNIKIAIINNGYLGMVRQWQQLFYNSRYSETPIYSPDYVRLAEAYRLPGYRVFNKDGARETMSEVQSLKGPALVEFVVEQHDMVYPMVPAGANLHEMIRRPNGHKGDGKGKLLDRKSAK
ncbi:MAG: biosynthetic-type acetolactate synthase large subunit [Candidatus Neomarinimicrobiota bacterium]|nr:biosynthetic-type acetolactate synthase large subunit [Candidatus Neomarinimicrobiota bacterium]